MDNTFKLYKCEAVEAYVSLRYVKHYVVAEDEQVCIIRNSTQDGVDLADATTFVLGWGAAMKARNQND